MSSFHRIAPWLPCLSALMLLAACDTSQPRLVFDAGSDAGATDATVDSGGLDGAIDADIPDGGADATIDDGAVPLDASDDAGLDSGLVPYDAYVPPVPPSCQPGTACGSGDSCDVGLVCVTNACGEKVCLQRGADCQGTAECTSGSACTDTAYGAFCTPTNGEVCNASSDCPPAHVCEGAAGARQCVQRRKRCAAEEDCPLSYACVVIPGETAFCEYVYRPCATVGTCAALGSCADIDGNGSQECGASTLCSANSSCTSPDRCVSWAGVALCGLGGLCNQSGGDACATGFSCLDLRGDGYGECVPDGGACAHQSDCPSGQICAVPPGGGAAQCFSAM